MASHYLLDIYKHALELNEDQQRFSLVKEIESSEDDEAWKVLCKNVAFCAFDEDQQRFSGAIFLHEFAERLKEEEKFFSISSDMLSVAGHTLLQSISANWDLKHSVVASHIELHQRHNQPVTPRLRWRYIETLELVERFAEALDQLHKLTKQHSVDELIYEFDSDIESTIKEREKRLRFRYEDKRDYGY